MRILITGAAGMVGRKSGEGFYKWSADGKRVG